ncbi:hypothetical protein GE21DRAFT_1357559 [Neurospora crassa]|nr:hypothetical protein GE21DRAFT_1357559 [Neurospora crassa]
MSLGYRIVKRVRFWPVMSNKAGVLALPPLTSSYFFVLFLKYWPFCASCTLVGCCRGMVSRGNGARHASCMSLSEPQVVFDSQQGLGYPWRIR